MYVYFQYADLCIYIYWIEITWRYSSTFFILHVSLHDFANDSTRLSGSFLYHFLSEFSKKLVILLTSSETMTSGYLSSDRKLKMHHILNASSSEIRRWFLLRFFLAHRVQHILLKSIRSKLSWTWRKKRNVLMRPYWTEKCKNNGHMPKTTEWNKVLDRFNSK